MADEIREVLIEDAKLMFRPNFSGTETETNDEGDRNFTVVLDEGTAEDLVRWGWNVKWRRAREEGDVDIPYISVALGYKFRPPIVGMITKRGRTYLSEDMVGLLDGAEIVLMDIIIRGVPWNNRGRSGIKAWLKTGFFTINEDYLQVKYADVPEANG
jgi:hypothetical protein